LEPIPVVVYNSIARQGQAASFLPQVEHLLREEGFAYRLQTSAYPGQAVQIARQAAEDGAAMVIAAGGDGTVQEVVNGLMQARLDGAHRPVLGVLPVGRGNDFAFSLAIPQELPAAVGVLTRGMVRKVDLGHLAGGDYPEGRYFVNGVGMGFDAVVDFEAAKIKWLKGAASYLLAVLRTTFLYAKAPVYEIEIDGESRTAPFLLVSVMNGRRLGGSFYMAPEGNPADGLLDLCLAGQVKQAAILPLAARFLNGTQGQHPAVSTTRARKVSVRAVTGTIPAHADGEVICTAGQQLSIELLPAALSVVAPSNEGAG
jgi:YegS/Rv2252/BmrU family lipid kinase